MSELGNGERVAGHLQCWVEGLLDPEAVVVLTGPCLVGSRDCTLITLLGLRSAAAW
jgi:hypothetical protein